MTTLTFDLSELDRELGDLLAHRWAVRLVGDHADHAQRVIAPPPSTTTLDYPWSVAGTTTGVILLCDAQVVKHWRTPPLRLLPGDVLNLTLVLT